MLKNLEYNKESILYFDKNKMNKTENIVLNNKIKYSIIEVNKE